MIEMMHRVDHRRQELLGLASRIRDGRSLRADPTTVAGDADGIADTARTTEMVSVSGDAGGAPAAMEASRQSARPEQAATERCADCPAAGSAARTEAA